MFADVDSVKDNAEPYTTQVDVADVCNRAVCIGKRNPAGMRGLVLFIGVLAGSAHAMTPVLFYDLRSADR